MAPPQLTRRPSEPPGRTADEARLVCPCGIDYRPLVTGRRGIVVVWAVLATVLTLGLYVLAAYIAHLRDDLPMGVRIAIAALPVWVLVVALFVQSGIGHRGGCLWRRAARFTLVGPGLALAEIGSAP